jgi:hypothetical protein
MPDARKHIALVVVNLRPGMDGGSSAMLELMHYVSRIGYQASIFNFLTSEPYYRTFLEERIASRGSGLTVSQNEMYRYREGEIDCQVRFLPCTIQELQLDRAPFLKAVAETLSKLQVNYVLTAERISVLAAHLLAMPGCHFFHSLGNIKRIQGMHPAYLSSVLRRETAAVSSFLRHKAKELLGVEATVLNPRIDFAAYVTPRDAQADAI